jgi:hypothetical protein
MSLMVLDILMQLLTHHTSSFWPATLAAGFSVPACMLDVLNALIGNKLMYVCRDGR